MANSKVRRFRDATVDDRLDLHTDASGDYRIS